MAINFSETKYLMLPSISYVNSFRREIMKLQPPQELGAGPEWRVGRKKGNRRYGNKNRKHSNHRGGKKGNWKNKRK